MKAQKRPWTRAEKLLFLAPLLIACASAGVWWRQSTTPQISVDAPSIAFVASAQFSPDGNRLLVVSNDKKTMRYGCAVYDVETRSKICDLQSPPSLSTGPNYGVSDEPRWSPDGTRIVNGHSTGPQIGVWNAQSGILQSSWLYSTADTLDYGCLASFSRDGNQIIGHGIPITIFNARSGAALRRFHSIGGHAWLNATQTLIAVTNARYDSLKVHETKSGRLLWQCQLQQLGDVQWSKNDVLVFQHQQKTTPDSHVPLLTHVPLVLWDSKSRKNLPSMQKINARSFWLHPNAPMVAVNSYGSNEAEDGSISVWDYHRNEVVWNHDVKKIVRALAWAPNGKHLAVLEEDDNSRLLQIFNLQGQMTQEMELDIGLNSLDWSSNSKQLAIAHDHGIRFVTLKDVD
jgi:dipeptidyl aminopeptidase/acylaminoacyl peptidase